MCLILFAHRVRADLPLVVAANRDEFHARPAAPARWWPDLPGVLAGRDLQDGGTWIGVHRSGRFAAVTNFSEEPPPPTAALRSRGELTARFLAGTIAAVDYLEELATRAGQYRGFNLLVGDGERLHFFGNRDGAPRELAPGVYGMSNDVLDCAWPKVTGGKDALRAGIDRALVSEGPLTHEALQRLTDDLFEVLADRSTPPDDALPQRGRDLEMERRIAPRFIVNDTYGTRASTAIVLHGAPGARHLSFAERRFGPQGSDLGRARHGFRVEPHRT